MRAFFRACGRTLDSDEPKEIEEALSSGISLELPGEVVIAEAMSACLVREPGCAR